MNDRFDPYAELGIARDATTEEIHAAYRKRAKETHPDTGNPAWAEKWASTCRALAVLEDPRRRKQYDETGAVDEGEPNNVKASALQLIENFIGTKVDSFLNDGKNDPRHADLFAEFRTHLRREIADAEAGIAKGKMVKVFVRDLGERFESPFPERPIERLFETRQRSIDAQIITLEEAIAARKIALEIVAAYSFDASWERDLVHPIFAEEPK